MLDSGSVRLHDAARQVTPGALRGAAGVKREVGDVVVRRHAAIPTLPPQR
jgi:hypothetical protein